jgi:hypothetical protein
MNESHIYSTNKSRVNSMNESRINSMNESRINSMNESRINVLISTINKNLIEIYEFGIYDEDIVNLIDNCYKLNNYLNNNYFTEILSELQSRLNETRDNFYISELIDKIRLFIKIYKNN